MRIGRGGQFSEQQRKLGNVSASSVNRVSARIDMQCEANDIVHIYKLAEAAVSGLRLLQLPTVFAARCSSLGGNPFRQHQLSPEDH